MVTNQLSTTTSSWSASGRIAELLKHEDDLVKVDDIRTRLQREKTGIDGQLKAGVQAQINTLVQGVKSLGEARSRIDRIRENMEGIHELRKDSEESVVNFDKINRVSRVLQNFEVTQRFLDNFLNMSSELDDIIMPLMVKDGRFESVVQPMDNLLEVHYRLSRLADVRDDAWHFAHNGSEDVKRTITKHFSNLQEAIKAFDTNLFEIAGVLLEILRESGRSLVVRVARIIDYEEKQDLVAELSADIIKNSDNGQNGQQHIQERRDTSATTTITTAMVFSQTLTNSRQKPRKYPKRFFAAIQESVAGIFETCHQTYPDNVEDLLANLGWIFNDLELVRTELVRCVPKRWNIFERMAGYYHKELYSLLDKEMKKEPTAAEILLIVEFVNDYYETMKSQFGMARDKLSPPLLDGKENELYDDYLALLVSKLREWYGNFAKTEKEPFITRQTSPIYSEATYFGMEGENILFRLIHQQIDVAASSCQGRVLAGCIEECAAILKERQQEWTQVMRQEVRKDLNDVVDENGESSLPPGLFDYLIALANDQIKAADMTEAISSKRAPSLSKKYAARVNQVLDDACDGFIRLAKACIGGMLELIFNDIVKPFSEIFVSSSWLKGKPMRQIVDTLREYIADCKTYQNPVVFDVFMEDLVIAAILHYLGALSNGENMIRAEKETDKATVRIKEDIGLLYDLFSDPEYNIPVELIQGYFKIFEHLLGTLTCPIPELSVQFQLLRRSFWDAPLDLFEKMIKARKGLDSKTVKEIMVQVRNAALQQSPSEPQQPPTFLAKYK